MPSRIRRLKRMATPRPTRSSKCPDNPSQRGHGFGTGSNMGTGETYRRMTSARQQGRDRADTQWALALEKRLITATPARIIAIPATAAQSSVWLNTSQPIIETRMIPAPDQTA